MASKPLSRRDVQIMCSLAAYGYLTTPQIARLHFPDTHPHTPYRLMQELCAAGYVSCITGYPHAQEWGGRKSVIYYLSKANVRKIVRDLLPRRLLHLAATLYDSPHIKTGNTFFLEHTLGIAEWLITLREAASDRHLTLPFAEVIDGRKHLQIFRPAFPIELVSGSRTRSVEPELTPDAVTSVANTILFFEYDNNSEKEWKWQNKLATYLAVLEAGLTTQVALYFSNRYNLGWSMEDCTRMEPVVLVAAPSDERRNELLYWTSRISQHRDRFRFCSMTDVTPQSILSNIWLSADDYRALYDKEGELPKEMLPSVRTRWRSREAAKLTRRSFLF